MSASRPMRRAGIAGVTLALVATSALAAAPATHPGVALAGVTPTSEAGDAAPEYSSPESASSSEESATDEGADATASPTGDPAKAAGPSALDTAAQTLGSTLDRLSTLVTPAAELPVRDAEATAPSGSVTVGIPGTFASSEARALLDRINAIRAEAAAEGVEIDGVPVSGAPLTWSSDLEWAAQIRAAELVVTSDHMRPSGGGPVFYTPNNTFGVRIVDENLGWASSAAEVVESWCAEKDAYQDDDPASAPHYRTLISDRFTCVGIGAFIPAHAEDAGTDENDVAVVALFSDGQEMTDDASEDETGEGEDAGEGKTGGETGTPSPTPAEDGTYLQDVNVATGYLSIQITGETTVAAGETHALSATVLLGGMDVTDQVALKWTVVNSKVATVDDIGNLTGVAPGSTRVSVSAADTLIASAAVRVTEPPATITSVTSDFSVETPSGAAPTLPVTATATFSDGTTEELPITWNAVDPALYTLRQGGTFDVVGTIEGWDARAVLHVSVKAAAAVSAALAADDESVSTEAGTAPKLPTTARVTWSNGDVTEEAVAWESIDPSSYAAAGSFTVGGVAGDTGLAVSCTVSVSAAHAVAVADPAGVATPSGTVPVLPATTQVTWSNGDVTEEAVAWNPTDPAGYTAREGGAFEATGAVEGWDGTVTCAVTVEPATPVSVEQPADVSCAAGAAPKLPATAHVTWSNGDTTEEAVTWEPVDAARYHDGGTFAVAGTAAGLGVSCEVSVAAAYLTAVADPAGVVTPSGTAPELPAAVTATWSNGDVTEEAVTWEQIDPAGYTAREGGAFDVTGAVEGWDGTVTCAVTVEAATPVSAGGLEAATEELIAPQLPATATLTWSNGDVTEEAVAWDALDPDAYAHAGTFTATGTAAGLPVGCAVTVEEPTVTAAADPAGVATPSGTAPALPANATATLSNGATEELPVTWDVIDPARYTAREGGSFTATGTVEGWDAAVSCAVKVEPATIASVADPSPVTTKEAVAPQLPAAVSATWSNGDVTEEAVAWDALDPDAYAQPGSAQASGAVAGWDAAVTCTVTVEAKQVASVDPLPDVTCDAGTAPALPASATVQWDNGTATSEAVTWDAVDASAYHDGGTFTVRGTVGATGAETAVTVNVSPATAVSAEAASASTPAGVAPQLPATLEVTWSNGDVTEEAVTWDTMGADVLSTPGSATVAGTFANERVTLAAQASVEIGEPVVVGVDAVADVTTVAGTRPVLPQTVGITLSDGTRTQAGVSWDPIASASLYCTPGSFALEGAVEGTDERARVTVQVGDARAQWAQATYVTTTVGTAPELPATVRCGWTTGTTTEEPVTWESYDAGLYAQAGTFKVAGTAAGCATTATVTVEAADQAVASTGDDTPAPAGLIAAFAAGAAALAGGLAAIVHRNRGRRER